jgi:hypothetical protein
MEKVDGEDPGGLGVQELPPGRAAAAWRGIDARGAQDLVDGRRAMAAPSLVSSPWIRRYPQSGFSSARRTARRAMLWSAGGRPGLRRLLVSYFLAASLRCQASSVAGVTGKIPAQRLRGMNHVSAVNQARSAGSYRTRPAWRRSTAFSWRSTRISASLASYPRNTRTATLNNQRISR